MLNLVGELHLTDALTKIQNHCNEGDYPSGNEISPRDRQNTSTAATLKPFNTRFEEKIQYQDDKHPGDCLRTLDRCNYCADVTSSFLSSLQIDTYESPDQ